MADSTEPVASRQSDQSEHNRQHGDDCCQGSGERDNERGKLALQALLRSESWPYRHDPDLASFLMASRVCQINASGLSGKQLL